MVRWGNRLICPLLFHECKDDPGQLPRNPGKRHIVVFALGDFHLIMIFEVWIEPAHGIGRLHQGASEVGTSTFGHMPFRVGLSGLALCGVHPRIGDKLSRRLEAPGISYL